MISLILSVIGVLVMPLGDIVLSIVLNILGILYGGIGWLLTLWALPSLIGISPQGKTLCALGILVSFASILGCVGSLLLIANDP
jgi:cellulose synthase/poly-beta-1,6-N-acetylglucosamine synthase-like glycosyltransferase